MFNMLQNKILFNQSSVNLEIIGLPDFSNNESKDKISIISQWRLMITDKPLIEGNLDHLTSIMNAFYIYANSIVNNEISSYESKLINIKADNLFTHNVLLKSSKADVEPLSLKIGNSALLDIISCFDQLNSSNKVRLTTSNFLENTQRKSSYKSFSTNKFFDIIVPPLISLFSIFITSSSIIYFYSNDRSEENKTSLNHQKNMNSTKSINTIV